MKYEDMCENYHQNFAFSLVHFLLLNIFCDVVALRTTLYYEIEHIYCDDGDTVTIFASSIKVMAHDEELGLTTGAS